MRTGFFYVAQIGGGLRLLHLNAKGCLYFQIYRRGIEYDNIIFVYSDKLLDRGTPHPVQTKSPGNWKPRPRVDKTGLSCARGKNGGKFGSALYVRARARTRNRKCKL